MADSWLLDSSRLRGIDRLLPALAALVPLAGLAELALRRWSAAASDSGWLPALLGLFLLGIGLTFLYVALIAPAREVIADGPARLLRLYHDVRLIGYRNRAIPFADIARVEARLSDDGQHAELLLRRYSRRGSEVILRRPAASSAGISALAQRLRETIASAG